MANNLQRSALSDVTNGGNRAPGLLVETSYPTSNAQSKFDQLVAHLSSTLGQENIVGPSLVAKSSAGVKTKTAPGNKKRKSTETAEENVNLDHIVVDRIPVDETCDQTRRKINRFLDAGAMPKGAFARTIGVSSKSLSGFLGEHGSMKGEGYAAYHAAWAYFKKREIAGLPMPKKQKTAFEPEAAAAAARDGKKAKTTPAATAKNASNSAGVDISDVYLDGEDEDEVDVFETCDEVRRKINAHLKKPGVTQAQFCRDIHAQFLSVRRPSGIQNSQLTRFRGMKGPYSGCTSSVYYGAYVFFEKVRIKQGKPKSKHREAMEDLHPEGFDRSRDATQQHFIVSADTSLYVDSYGCFHSM